MKEIIKEQIKRYPVWVSVDGKEFENKEECKLYENSARGVLMSKYREYCDINTVTEEKLTYFGSCDNEVDIVKINNKEAIDVILQIMLLHNVHMSEDSITRYRNLLNTYYNKESIFFISRGYEKDCFWVLEKDLQERLDHMSDICNQGKVIITEKDEIE